MHKISVPLVRYYERREENIAEARRLGATRVFVCPSRGLGTKEWCEGELARIEENIKYYEDAGFEVGVWISSIGHGGNLVGAMNDEYSGMSNVVGIRGNSAGDSFCPLDETFSNRICEWVRSIARAGAKLIMVDDDYRLSTRAGDSWCACETHMEEYCRRLGEKITREEVLEKAFRGGPNRYRDVWYDLMGDTLRDFAAKLRAAVDEVSPEIRLGACSCITVWDGDGTDSIELARIFAGNTKPFIRFIGAAYWPAFWGGACSSLPYVIELERMQRFWCENEDIEIFAEGDVYPRPRHFVPSAYLETMDMAVRVDGGFDGILKYGIDYGASPVYETGYADRAERNKPIYEGISRLFDGKKNIGISAACEMKRLRNRYFDDPGIIGGNADDGFFQPEQAFLTGNSIPVTYGDGSDVKIAFGENARYLSMEEKGFILDVPGAKHLEAMGIDTGLASAEKLSSVSEEIFPSMNEHIYQGDPNSLYGLRAKEGGEEISFFAGEEKFASALKYENAQGKRFLILGCDAQNTVDNKRFYKNYCRQAQLIEAAEWMAGKPLPAVCTKNPELYLMCKRGDTSMSVAMFNVFYDAVLDPVIKLDRNYSHVRFVNCSGTLSGNEVHLDRE
ncbi:MAG: hypothetical protein IKZ19_10180, partial [Clostridia bacterium]|nr:hypothetical protein [Clostridia bacterium]